MTDPQMRKLVVTDNRAGLRGLLMAGFTGTWISDPYATERAQNKILVGGERSRHRLSPAGDRSMSHMIHIAAISQIRLDTMGGPTTGACPPTVGGPWRPCGA
ncbi:hypothetical protein AB4Z14_21210 [Terrabacter sp. 2TAF16]|uniref:hypothetical protein n=1 Tax=Terrabacter sp. 2TAF16 TaxID=3233008 RepID=UPI003F9C70B2